MERKIEFSIDEHYHVYNRGVDKRLIFNNNQDYERFTTLLFVANGTEPVNLRESINKPWSEINRGEAFVDIGAWCLMPNHFHLLLREKTEKGISRFLAKLLTAYSMYFNVRYQRTGRLFEGNFRATHADKDEYLKYLFSYIHLNPVKLVEPEWKEKGLQDENRAKNFLSRHRFSSYLDYLGEPRQESLILNKEAFPQYFNSKLDFSSQLSDWLSYKG
ncbi:MAG: transposase [Patescibacteria group bacterium]